jgi:hypothetical protein
MALGKKACFAKCHTKHSAKYLTWDHLWQILCPVLSGRHSANLRYSAKTPSPSTRRRNGCFSLPSAREKVLVKEGFADALCAEPFLASATLDKAFAECF